MASKRSKIVNAIVTALENSYDHVTAEMRFWNEVNDFPYICVVAGQETREYLAAGFAWGFLNVSLKLYVKGESAQADLETLLGDVETTLSSFSGRIPYDSTNTAEVSITSINTDEGLLKPYAIGEINLVIRYQASGT
jgi:hypothetical protein